MGVCACVMVCYKGGRGGQKVSKNALRNLWMAPLGYGFLLRRRYECYVISAKCTVSLFIVCDVSTCIGAV